ncbi:MAG: GrpB family protein [Pleurocapsa sp. MO_226.B13]|nr:GrpB family protein [Pleurocapsa sp. MO_226.B13]
MDEIIIAKYNPDWKFLFQEEVVRLRRVLDTTLINRIEHFGSTAVPGLAAKPVIDILIGVNSLVEARQAVISPLESLGYAYWSDNPDPQRMFFVKGLPPNSPRTHHVHLVEPDSILWERLLFRDYLRQHPDEATHYARLKQQLARGFSNNREAYTQGKTEYIKSVMDKAKRSISFGGQ